VSDTVEQIRQPRVIDVIAALIERERDEDAAQYQMDAAMLALFHDLTVEEVLYKTIDEYVELFTVERLTIPEKRGYDKVFYGEAAFTKEKIL